MSHLRNFRRDEALQRNCESELSRSADLSFLSSQGAWSDLRSEIIATLICWPPPQGYFQWPPHSTTLTLLLCGISISLCFVRWRELESSQSFAFEIDHAVHLHSFLYLLVANVDSDCSIFGHVYGYLYEGVLFTVAILPALTGAPDFRPDWQTSVTFFTRQTQCTDQNAYINIIWVGV